NQQGFVLDGAGAFVEIGDGAAGNVAGGDFTVSLWVNFAGTTGEQVLIEKWAQGTRAGWSLAKSADHRLRLTLGNGAGEEAVVESAPLGFTAGRWLPVAARRQGNQFALFTNGVVVASGSHALDLTSPATLKFGSHEGTGAFLNGRMDEVTLYRRALTDGEVASVAGGVSVAGPLTVTLNAGVLPDEWGNLNEGATVAFAAIGQEGAVYFEAEPEPSTGAVRLARSSLGSPFLFHGQYFDYDSGLVYLRARFYDPFSGMFLAPDPLGYEDSVNLYAGMGNNPVTFRDPSGLKWGGPGIAAGWERAWKFKGSTAMSRGGPGASLRHMDHWTPNAMPTRGGAIASGFENAWKYDAQMAKGARGRGRGAYRPEAYSDPSTFVSRSLDSAAQKKGPAPKLMLGKQDKNNIPYAMKAHPLEGHQDIVAHGKFRETKDGKQVFFVEGPNGEELDVKAFADLVRNHPERDPELSIRLLVCNAGADQFAADFAREMQTKVMAANRFVWPDAQGLVVVSSTAPFKRGLLPRNVMPGKVGSKGFDPNLSYKGLEGDGQWLTWDASGSLITE
ncbi:MAG: hypothetical protein KIT22_12925, partial [Verrucomicrobiae bacterium]|nr:hypothetical protein [Verrucomicrobiae bacterium]